MSNICVRIINMSMNEERASTDAGEWYACYIDKGKWVMNWV